MSIDYRAFEREEQILEQQLAEGEIDIQEFNRQMRGLQQDVREHAQEEAENAYRDAMGWY